VLRHDPMPCAAAAAERRIVHGARPILWPVGHGWIPVPLGGLDRQTKVDGVWCGVSECGPRTRTCARSGLGLGWGRPAVLRGRNGPELRLGSLALAREEYLYCPLNSQREEYTQQQSALSGEQRRAISSDAEPRRTASRKVFRQREGHENVRSALAFFLHSCLCAPRRTPFAIRWKILGTLPRSPPV